MSFLSGNNKKQGFLTLVLALAILIICGNNVKVEAGVYPTYPVGVEILKPGDPLNIVWRDDGKAPSLEKIPQLKVEFMSGGDLNQTSLAIIGTVPGSDGKISWTVPTVDPAGKIYFLKFSFEKSEWFTTRFIVTDLQGKYPPPPSPPPPVGKNPGGNGHIVSSSNSTSTPGGGAAGNSTGSATGNAGGNVPGSAGGSSNSTGNPTGSGAAATPSQNGNAGTTNTHVSVASGLEKGFVVTTMLVAVVIAILG